MSGKRADGGNKLVTGLAGFAASFGAKKVISFLWRRVTGHEPPEHPEDPQVALGEALAWGIVLGVGVQVARMLATRFAVRRTEGPVSPAE